MNGIRNFAIIASIAAVAAIGCKKKDEKEPNTAKPAAGKPAADPAKPEDTSATSAKPGDPPSAKPAAAGGNIKVNAELMDAMKAVASACDVDVKMMRITCKNKEDATLDGMFGYSAPKLTPLPAIGTMAVALSSDDAKLRTVAASMMGSRFRSAWGKDVKVGAVDPEIATTLLAAVPKLGEYQGRRAITGIAYAAALANKSDDLIKVLDATSDKYLKTGGYKASMFYGRMTVFPKIQELAKSADKNEVLAAVSAAANFYEYTDEEKAALCPWAQTMLSADDEKVEEAAIFEQAGYVLTRCSGKWIDALLDFGESQLKTKNKFGRRYYFVFRNLCFSMMRGVQKEAATPAQCKRNFTYLEKAANNKKVSSQHRAFALDAIPYQRRNAESLKLMQKYKNHKDPEIKKTALAAIKMLEGYVKKK